MTQKPFEEFEEVAQKGKKQIRILIPITKICEWWKRRGKKDEKSNGNGVKRPDNATW